MVTMDVSSLYTNIDNDEGIDAMVNNTSLKSRYSDSLLSFIKTLMHLILSLNNFIFNGTNYHQVKGTAMGTRAAPNYANIYMGWFEEKHIYSSRWKQNISFYCRYIDDIFLIWDSSLQELEDFMKYINNVHPSIKFTHEKSKEKINFLDILVMKDKDGVISTDVYQKPTDTHNYLQFDSSHPKHCIRSIPYSQFTRLKKIISEPETLKRWISEFTEYFVNSEYPRSFLRRVANDVLGQRKDANKQPKQNTETTKVLTTFNERLPNLNNLIEKHWSITQTNEKCRRVLKSPPRWFTQELRIYQTYL